MNALIRRSILIVAAAGWIIMSEKIAILNVDQKVNYMPNLKLMSETIKKHDICSAGCYRLNENGGKVYEKYESIYDYYFDSEKLFPQNTMKESKEQDSLPIIGLYQTDATIIKVSQDYGYPVSLKLCRKRNIKYREYPVLFFRNRNDIPAGIENICEKSTSEKQ